MSNLVSLYPQQLINHLVPSHSPSSATSCNSIWVDSSVNMTRHLVLLLPQGRTLSQVSQTLCFFQNPELCPPTACLATSHTRPAYLSGSALLGTTFTILWSLAWIMFWIQIAQRRVNTYILNTQVLCTIQSWTLTENSRSMTLKYT